MNIADILHKSTDWKSFKEQITLLQEKQKGDCFESLTKYFLQLHPTYFSQLQNVWLLKDVPPDVREYLNLPSSDEGIDLIAQTIDNDYWAIQSKYKEDENHSLGRDELSTFTDLAFGICKNIQFGLVCTTADRFSHKLELYGNRLGFCSGEVWRGLDKDFFLQIHEKLDNKPFLPEPLQPLEHQIRAIENAYQHFIEQGNSRGKLISPCGSGKSLTGYWIAEKLEGKKLLIAVPSLSLVRQTLAVWLRECVANKREFNWIVVCSDETVKESSDDDIAIIVQDLGILVHTDSDEISNWLVKHQNKNVIVFTTYQSGKVTADSARKSGYEFDIGILDEAHKTAGKIGASFSHLLHEENIKIKRRIFMTATERCYQGSSDDIASMDDLELYGNTFEYLSFKEAIESQPPILSDYKIITIFVRHSEVRDMIQRNLFVKPNTGKWDEELEARAFTALIALRKAMQENPISHTVSFHRSIETARTFKVNQDIFTKSFPEFGELDTFFVSGKTPTSLRSKEIENFARSPRSLISNARCLTEGVDVPKINCVLFADPRQSAVDIVQATGRVLRRYDGKEFGYVIVPVLLEDDSTLSDESFEAIITIVKALGANDERIIEYFRSTLEGKKSKKSISPLEADIPVGVIIDSKEFIKSIELSIWFRLAKLSWRPFEEAREFTRRLGLKGTREWHLYSQGKLENDERKPEDIPSNPCYVYKNKGWIGWGDWLGTINIGDYKEADLSFEEELIETAKELFSEMGLEKSSEWWLYCKGELEEPDEIIVTPQEVSFDAGKNDKFRSYIKLDEEITEVYGLPDEDFRGEDCIEEIPISSNMVLVAPLENLTPLKRSFQYRTFGEAREFVRGLCIKGPIEWRLYSQGKLAGREKKPNDIPLNPNQYYKNEGWISWDDWLGVRKVTSHSKKERSSYKDKGLNKRGNQIRTEFRPFEEAREFVRSWGLNSMNEWTDFVNRGLPKDIPINPSGYYAGEGWVNWEDWLGTKVVAPSVKESFSPFEEAREFVRNLKINNMGNWDVYAHGLLIGKGRKPKNIPSNPHEIYNDKGWIDWDDWLGKE